MFYSNATDVLLHRKKTVLEGKRKNFISKKYSLLRNKEYRELERIVNQLNTFYYTTDSIDEIKLLTYLQGNLEMEFKREMGVFKTRRDSMIRVWWYDYLIRKLITLTLVSIMISDPISDGDGDGEGVLQAKLLVDLIFTHSYIDMISKLNSWLVEYNKIEDNYQSYRVRVAKKVFNLLNLTVVLESLGVTEEWG